MRVLDGGDASDPCEQEDCVYLRVMVDTFPFQDEQTTLRFEKYLIEQERLGWRLLAWTGNDDGIKVIFDRKVPEMEFEDEMSKTEWDKLTQNLQVAPWQVFTFEPLAKRAYSLRKGELITVLRLAVEYADLIEVGDPVALIAMNHDKVATYEIGQFTLVSVQITTIAQLNPADLKGVSKLLGRPVTSADYLPYLERIYGHPVRRMDDLVVAMTLRAEKDIFFNGAQG